MPNPVAVITGASSGLGAEFARQLAARGYDLLLIARRLDRLQQLAVELARAHSIAAEACAADLAGEAGIAAAAARVAAEPRLALLVNNAGFGTKGRFYKTDVAGQLAMHRVHMDATMRLCHAALGAMVPRNRGAIVNVSSVAGFVRSPANVSYCATKAWMNAFTEGLYLELRGAGSAITVQALCPGFIHTGFHDAMGADPAPVPGWLWLRAEDVVGASLTALPSGRLYIIPGWKYRLFVAGMTKLPAGLRLFLESRVSHTKKRL